MPGYVYKGTIFDADIPLAPPRPRKSKAAVAECGTLGGVARHRRLGEPVCDEICKGFMSAYKREWRARVKAKKASV